MEYIYLFLNVYIFIFIFLIYIFDEKSKMLYGYFMKKQSVYDYKDTISDVDIDSLAIPSSILVYLFSGVDGIEMFFEHDVEIDYYEPESFEDLNVSFENFLEYQEWYEQRLARISMEYDEEDFFSLDLDFNLKVNYVKSIYEQLGQDISKKNDFFLYYKTIRQAKSLIL